jgi:hypothetical protein
VIEGISGISDVSICTWPCYEATSVGIRSSEGPMAALRTEVPTAAAIEAAARHRQLQLMAQAVDDGLLEATSTRSDSRLGQRISAPSWFKPRARNWRHGCVHVLT